jgi:hypothetical protein
MAGPFQANRPALRNPSPARRPGILYNRRRQLVISYCQVEKPTVDPHSYPQPAETTPPNQ